MLTKGSLLDRMEILYPYDNRISDLRRSYLDRDLSSIFRFIDYLWDTNFEDVRKAVMEKNLHSVFRLLDAHPEINNDLRKATLEDNLWSLFRMFDPEESSLVEGLIFDHAEELEPTDFKKFVMNDNTWALYRLLLDLHDTRLLHAIKSFHADGTRWKKDALSRGQLKSKMWLVDELKTLDVQLGTVFLCAGWYGILALLLFEHGFDIDRIRSFDIDPEVEPIADKFNLPWFSDQWRFKAITDDIHNINFESHNWTAWSNTNKRESYPITDVPDTIINTSCEHIENFSEWYAKIPEGKLVILQSNDFEDVDEHVNTASDLFDFAKMTPMSDVLFSGDLELENYSRFMRIGYK